ncbi:winged helix DNA-binding domain-containing protein [Kribbella monticola]|uniref:winged helix DNA-binding domain-containing protein n=1 Tax=Kribbella monticola TaxID=2185285 RepID=UPI000DD3E4D1|nr:winged helix DNA-binding domain-containing protein [Kribbella monticola]
MRHVTDDERRARLAVRHALAPPFRVKTPEAATEAMTALHATEAASVYLSCGARVDGFELADLDRALYEDRSLVKQLAMRRTLFVFPRDLLPHVWSSASARVATAERARIAKGVVKVGLTTNGEQWLKEARTQLLALLAATPDGCTTADVRAAVPMIDVKVELSAGQTFTASGVLTLLSLSGEIVRGVNTGRWFTSRHRWTLMDRWLGATPPPPPSATDGYRELVRRWLHSFGPGTEDDLVWWLGATKSAVRTALQALDAVEVSLDGGATGWLLADDLDEVRDPGPWVALLPVLDPTVMGWKGRDFYLGPHREQIFEIRGNAGTTAWVDGRVVGCWVQDGDGVVRVALLEKVSARARRALDAEAVRLTQWLAGQRIGTPYSTPAMKAALAE